MSVINTPQFTGTNSISSASNKLANISFSIYGIGHFLHLTTGSYAQHMALGELYTGLPALVDPIIENLMSNKSWNIKYTNVDLTGAIGIDLCDTVMAAAQELHTALSSNDPIPTLIAMISDVEALISFISGVKYKLVRLS